MSAAELQIPRKVWTRSDVELIDPILAETLELINGELIDQMGKKPPHIFWTDEIREWLQAQFGGEFVRPEHPIDVSPEDNPTNEPEPDISVTTNSRRETRGANPTPRDLRLVVEISDRSFHFDMGIKAGLYARAGIREYWVIDVRDTYAPVLIVHLRPSNGKYQDIARYSHTDAATVLDGRQIRLQDCG